jgi:formate dehydrogenase subunit gamma
MTMLLARLRFILGALALLALLAAAPQASAQVRNPDGSVNPTASAVKEEQLLQQLRQIRGLGTIPDTRSYTIEHPQGREWRAFHEVWLPWAAALLILGMVVLLAVFFLVRGRVRIEGGWSGRKLLRFDAFERFVHWMTAASFVCLGLTGLNITFGKRLLLPLMDPDTFSTWSQWAKYVHNYLSFAFTIGIVLMFAMWIRSNFFTRVDVDWLKRGGGLVGHDHPPAYRFNAGQKMLFWFNMLGGVGVAVTGYLLMFPFYGTNINEMELAQVFHSLVAALFITLIIAHIYLGTLGEEGAFDAMWDGQVDVNWAKTHHSLWYQEEMAHGGAPSGSSRPIASPAE